MRIMWSFYPVYVALIPIEKSSILIENSNRPSSINSYGIVVSMITSILTSLTYRTFTHSDITSSFDQLEYRLAIIDGITRSATANIHIDSHSTKYITVSIHRYQHSRHLSIATSRMYQ